MSKKDEALTQFEDVLKELKKGEEESAATSVMGPSRSTTNISGALFKLVFKFWGRKILLILLLLLAITSGFIWSFSGSTYKKESTTYVEQIREIATLATAEAHLKTVINEEDNKVFGKDISFNLPGTKRELFLIVPATVIAGVDLKEITSDDIQVNEKDKTMKITLPRAKLLHEPAIQMDRVQTFSDEGLFRGEMKWDEGYNLAAEAQEKLKNEAIEIGLLATAEKNAVKALESFFSNLDYTVQVIFK